MDKLKLSTEMREIPLDASGKAVVRKAERVETLIEKQFRQIEILARELANFESIEEMGPGTIRSIGHRILGLADDIHRSETEK